VTIHKAKLADLETGYAISTVTINRRPHVIAAPEGKGPFVLFSPPDWKPTILTDGPGGVMSIVGLPRHESAFAAITSCYPIYHFEGGKVSILQPGKTNVEEQVQPQPKDQGAGSRTTGNQGKAPMLWSSIKGFDLPFGHRLETINIGGDAYLVAATLASAKENADDWSRSGTVYMVRIPEQLDSIWERIPILDGITKNHGLHHASFDGRDTLFVGGSQGLIALSIPSKPDGIWERQTILAREVSEVYAADLDEDGQQELVTIEPFHGNQLSVYKRSGDRIDGSWHRLFEADLSFGHGLWAGSLGGEPAVMAGSRSGEMDLSVFSIQSLVPFVAQRSIIDQGAGPTQTVVLHEDGQDLIFSVNQAKSEVAMYTVSP